MFAACAKSCSLSDPTSDTVRIIMPTAITADELRHARDSELEEKAQRMAAIWLHLCDAAEASVVNSMVEHRQCEKREAAVAAAAAQAAKEAAEREQLEREQLQQQRLRQQEEASRKVEVEAFLKQHGFKGVNTGKSSLLKTTYPLHEAAKLNNLDMVKMLLAEGANPAQKNSRGKTASQRAAQKDKAGSHASVIRYLNERCSAPGVHGATAGGA
eukprot:TRINITY_DN13322_c0_g1_i1.p1 TRINITY_DN13322_c0_g1~~TRINITY_DN13322_c0_g1_i1.p1  ORF type:complete len:214 (+),score=51.93 TRINITY_DN13322_c0_g1_i1:82-723(+)